MAKSKYTEICEEIERKVKSSAKENGKYPVSTSTSDLNQMAQVLMNTPEHTVTEYHPKATDSEGNPVTVTKQPAKRYRESLKPMLRSMGIDKNEVDKLDEYHFSKEAASAVMELAGTVVKDYIGVGRKYKFPITDMNETQMAISCTDVKEKTTKTNKFVVVDGKTVSVPTGKTVKTANHKAIKVSNAIPHWLKEDIE